MKSLKAGVVVVLAVLVAAMSAGCFYINLNTAVGNGEMETREIELDSAVTGLVNQTSVDVVIDMDLQEKAVLEAESNLIDLIDVSQSGDGMITVDMKPNISITMRKTMTLRIPAIEGGRIEVRGSGDISQTGGTLTGDSFDVRIAGSGDIQLDLKTADLSLTIEGSGDMSLRAATDEIDTRINGSGTISIAGETQKLNVSVNGSGDFKGFDLYAQDANVIVDGSGDINVYVTEALTGSIDGSGDITYDGDPDSVDISDNGSGDVHQR